MEIKIGIQNVAREATLNVDLTADQVVAAYTQAKATDGLLRLTDTSGRHMMIPAGGIGYIEFGQEHARPVGFGA
jgi:hypothetical protein